LLNFPADAPGFAVAAQAAAASLQRAQAFLQAFLERAADGHRFANAFHLCGERDGGRAPAPACGYFSKAKRVPPLRDW